MWSKNFFNLFVFLIIAGNCLGQDTIFMRNDQRIACKVFEVTQTEVKYKKLEQSDGPFYIEDKSSIARIKYTNGFIDIFSEIQSFPITQEKKVNGNYTMQKQYPDLSIIKGERSLYLYDGRAIRENDLHELLLSLNNPKLTDEVRRAKLSKGLSYIGFLAVPLGVIGGMLALNAYGIGGLTPFNDTGRNYKTISALFLGGAAVSISATVYFDIRSNNANAKAIRLYRQSYLNQ